jgi:hypothetical protein
MQAIIATAASAFNGMGCACATDSESRPCEARWNDKQYEKRLLKLGRMKNGSTPCTGLVAG